MTARTKTALGSRWGARASEAFLSRLLSLIALAFVAGVGFADRVFAPRGWPLAVGAVLLLAGALSRRRARACACACCILVLAFGAGTQALWVELEAADRDRPGGPFDASVRSRVCDKRESSGFVEVELCGAGPGSLGSRTAPHSVPGRLLLSAAPNTPERDWLAVLVPGDSIVAWLRIDAPRPATNPGARDRARALARRGIGARARLLDARRAVRMQMGADSLRARWHRARARLGERVVAAGPGGALLAALGLGDRRALREEDREAFRRLGISHLLAVSGLHLGLVGALAFLVVRSVLLRSERFTARMDLRWPAAVIALAVALGYALLVGFGAPVRRAWFFGLAAVGSWGTGRGGDAGTALAAALFAVALLEPAAVFSLGAQLSFVATAALIASAGGPVPNEGPQAEGRGRAMTSGREAVLRRVARAAVGGLRVSACAIAATAPVLAAHGLASAPIGLLSNVVAVPLTAALLLPASLAAVAMAAVSDSSSGVVALARVAEGALGFARWASASLDAPVSSPPPVALALLVSVGLAVVCVRARRSSVRVVACLLCCAVVDRAPRAVEGPAPPRVVAFDVGQGDAILVQGRSAAVLVDAGWARGRADQGRSVVVPGLRALGVERLDLVIATHADADHRGGLPSVVRQLPVGEIWLPRGAAAEFPGLREVARARGIPVRERGQGDAAWQRGDVWVRPLWPPSGRRARSSRNHASLVAQARVGEVRLLLVGDIDAAAEHELLRAPERLRSELLKVAHHGSSSSSTQAFLEAVDFDLALLSSACAPGRALPSPTALERLSRAGGSTWWTGRDGALIVALGVGLRGEKPTRSWGWEPGMACRRR